MPTATLSPNALETRTNYLIQLDGLRCIAVTLVMLDHWLGEVNPLPIGFFGVNLFFVLSGFLITRILITSKQRDDIQGRSHGRALKTFYIRRNLRIFPVYYLTIFVLAAFTFPAVREHLGWLLTYTTNIWIAVHQTWLGAIDHLWSLAVEEQYYLFFPFLIFFIPDRFVLPVLFSMIGLSVGLRVILFILHAPWVDQFVLMPTCLDAFGMGGLLAWLLVYQPDRFGRILRHNGYLLGSVALYGMNLYLYKTLPGNDQHRNIVTDVTDRLVTSIFCFFLIGRAVVGYGGLAKWLLEHPVSQYLGRISYGLYLFHNLVFNFYHTPPTFITLHIWEKAGRLLPVLADAPGLRLLYFYTLTVLVATISWRLIEKPVNSLKDRFSY